MRRRTRIGFVHVIWSLLAAAVAAVFFPLTAGAQQGQPPAHQQSGEWAKLPRMQLERQFAGPLQDTIVQRWRDPVDGTICYIYLPITAEHTPPTPSGFVQYGANVIGSLSCFAPAPPPSTAAKRPPPSTPAGAPAPAGEHR